MNIMMMFKYMLKCKTLKRIPCDLKDPSWMYKLIDNGFKTNEPVLWLMEELLCNCEQSYVI